MRDAAAFFFLTLLFHTVEPSCWASEGFFCDKQQDTVIECPVAHFCPGSDFAPLPCTDAIFGSGCKDYVYTVRCVAKFANMIQFDARAQYDSAMAVARVMGQASEANVFVLVPDRPIPEQFGTHDMWNDIVLGFEEMLWNRTGRQRRQGFVTNTSVVGWLVGFPNESFAVKASSAMTQGSLKESFANLTDFPDMLGFVTNPAVYAPGEEMWLYGFNDRNLSSDISIPFGKYFYGHRHASSNARLIGEIGIACGVWALLLVIFCSWNRKRLHAKEKKLSSKLCERYPHTDPGAVDLHPFDSASESESVMTSAASLQRFPVFSLQEESDDNANAK